MHMYASAFDFCPLISFHIKEMNVARKESSRPQFLYFVIWRHLSLLLREPEWKLLQRWWALESSLSCWEGRKERSQTGLSGGRASISFSFNFANQRLYNTIEKKKMKKYSHPFLLLAFAFLTPWLGRQIIISDKYTYSSKLKSLLGKCVHCHFI